MVPGQVRSFLQIDTTMRILLCLLLACSVIATDAQAQSAKISQAAAVAEIRKLGGRVKFDKKNPGTPIAVTLSGPKVTDVGLVHLKGLTRLQSLTRYGPKVTDAGLVHLKGLTKLKTLDLRFTDVTGSGLVHLKGLTKLQSLDLSLTKVTDAGLVHLKGLTKLKSLDLGNTKVTAAGVKDLQAALPKCRILK